MSLSRRRLLAAVLGAAGIATAAACTGPSEVKDPPAQSSGPDTLRDDIPAGITVEDRGFATFPVPDGNTARSIVGAAAVFRNTTAEPMRVHIRFRFTDKAGRGWQSAEQNDWTAIVNAGWAYLPPGKAVELGGNYQVDAAEAARVAGIKLYVTGEPAKPSALLTAKVVEVEPRPNPTDKWDYVSFTVNNPGFDFEEPNYGMTFRSAEGRLVAGWFVDRANWVDAKAALPNNETDKYDEGSSRHTLPTWLPPGTKPNGVTMYVWSS